MTATPEMTLDTKREMLARFIERKSAELDALRKRQRQQLDSANDDDIDNTNLADSPKAQMMDEIEQQATHLDHVQAEVDALHRIDLARPHDSVSPGSLVRTNAGYFLVGVALAPLQVDGKKVTGISTQSPLYQKMQGLRARAEFHLGNVEYVIAEII
jgi:hypothetical protein